MKKIFFIFFLFLIGVCHCAWGDIEPIFDIQILYHQAPIVCKVAVEALNPFFLPKAEKNRSSSSLIVVFNIHRYYKGKGPHQVKMVLPLNNDPDSAEPMVNGRDREKIQKGQELIVFFKKEKNGFRFWLDGYQSCIPVTRTHSSGAEGFEAVREDLVNSIDEPWVIAQDSFEQIRMHGWTEALAKLTAITVNHDGYAKYWTAILTRLYLGDRSAIEESLKLFDKSYPFAQRCSILFGKEYNDCLFLQNIQMAFLYAYIDLGSTKCLNLMQAIAHGQIHWLRQNVVNLAKFQIRNVVTARDVLEAGDQLASVPLDQCSVIGFNWQELGYRVIKAAGREDWYYTVRYDVSQREQVCAQMQHWWKEKGRNIFLSESMRKNGG